MIAINAKDQCSVLVPKEVAREEAVVLVVELQLVMSIGRFASAIDACLGLVVAFL